jgi:hypothetical protein
MLTPSNIVAVRVTGALLNRALVSLLKLNLVKPLFGDAARIRSRYKERISILIKLPACLHGLGV